MSRLRAPQQQQGAGAKRAERPRRRRRVRAADNCHPSLAGKESRNKYRQIHARAESSATQHITSHHIASRNTMVRMTPTHAWSRKAVFDSETRQNSERDRKRDGDRYLCTHTELIHVAHIVSLAHFHSHGLVIRRSQPLLAANWLAACFCDSVSRSAGDSVVGASVSRSVAPSPHSSVWRREVARSEGGGAGSGIPTPSPSPPLPPFPSLPPSLPSLPPLPPSPPLPSPLPCLPPS